MKQIDAWKMAINSSRIAILTESGDIVFDIYQEDE